MIDQVVGAILGGLLNSGGGGGPVAQADASTVVEVNPDIYSINVMDTGPLADALAQSDSQTLALVSNIKTDLAELLKILAAGAVLVWVIARKL